MQASAQFVRESALQAGYPKPAIGDCGSTVWYQAVTSGKK